MHVTEPHHERGGCLSLGASRAHAPRPRAAPAAVNRSDSYYRDPVSSGVGDLLQSVVSKTVEDASQDMNGGKPVFFRKPDPRNSKYILAALSSEDRRRQQ